MGSGSDPGVGFLRPLVVVLEAVSSARSSVDRAIVASWFDHVSRGRSSPRWVTKLASRAADREMRRRMEALRWRR